MTHHQQQQQQQQHSLDSRRLHQGAASMLHDNGTIITNQACAACEQLQSHTARSNKLLLLLLLW